MIRQPLIVCSFNSFCYICSVNSKIEPKHSNNDKADNKVFFFGTLAGSTASDDICTECMERFLGNSSRVDGKG